MDLDFQITSNVTRTEDQTPPYSSYTFCKKTVQEQHHISLRTSSDLKVYSHLSPGLENKYSLKELIFRDVILKCSCFTFIKQNISEPSACRLLQHIYIFTLALHCITSRDHTEARKSLPRHKVRHCMQILKQ